MVAYDTPHTTRAFTRKTYKKTYGPPVRTKTLKSMRKTPFPATRTVIPPLKNSGKTLVKMNNEARETKRVKRAVNMATKRELKLARRKARDLKAMIDQINEPDIRDNIGLYINGNGKLVSDEGVIVDAQYELLIEELQNRLDPNDDEYEQRIINKAIRFVMKSRDANQRNLEINSLAGMMSGLSTGN